MAAHYASPIPDEHLPQFDALEYYPPNAEWVLSGVFDSTDSSKITVPSSIGTESPYTMLGIVAVEISGAAYELTVLDDGDGGAFIPFRDATCGDSTYEGGRYLPVDVTAGRSVVLDFNAAHNPWCVYDEEFVCPLPPGGNSIGVEITAGEKMYVPRDGH